MKKVDDCEQILDDSRDQKLAEKRFMKKIVRIASASPASGPVLSKKNGSEVLRGQMAISLLKVVICSWEDVPEGKMHSAYKMHV